MTRTTISSPHLLFLFGVFLCLYTGMKGQETAGDGKATGRANIGGTLSSDDQVLAQEYFNEGKYADCIRLVDSLKNNFAFFSKQVKEDLLVLKVKALLELDNIPEAEKATRELFKFNPHYEVDLINSNTEDFNRMIRSYDVHPLLSLGVRNSVLFPNLRTPSVFPSPIGLDNTIPYTYSKNFLMYYAWAEYQLKGNLSINMDFVYWGFGFSRYWIGPGDLRMNYSEYMKFVEVPVFLKRYLLIPIPVLKNILPYVTGGFSWLYMTQAYSNISKSNTTYSYYNPNINVLPQMNQNTYEWLVGAGIGYKIKNLRIFLDWRYYGGINSFTNDSQRNTNGLLYNGYGYAENKIILGKSEVGASISLTFKNTIVKRKNGSQEFKVQTF
jgi:hypothetical protein